MKRSPFVPCAAALACASLAGTASAQYQTDFEAYGLGTVVGQNGWFQPVAGSNDFFVVNFNDAANFNVDASPSGGAQCIAGTSLNAPNTFARSQQFANWSAGDIYTMHLDFWADCPAPAITTSNLGSFSMQPFGVTPYTNQGINTLLYYNTDGDPAGTYSIAWNLHNSDGTDFGGFWGPDDILGTWPGGPWSNLQLRNWYRGSFVVDFATGQVLKLGIRNLATGQGIVYIAVGGAVGFSDDGNWYMAGGANNVRALPRPDQVRAFVGGQGNGNVVAFDNINITLGDNLFCPADFNQDGFVDGIDYDMFNAAFESFDPAVQITADYNGDGFVDGIDYDQFNAAFESLCP